MAKKASDFERVVTSGARILLHCCCAVCGAGALDEYANFRQVASVGNLDCYYFNPNIKPIDEWHKRKEQLEILCGHFGVGLIESEYYGELFDQVAKGLEGEKEGGFRCKMCFELRLRRTATQAKAGGYEYFCTTLTASPLKNSDLINKIGHQIGQELSINYLPSNFKKNNGNLRSKSICTQLNLYRQNYCGCNPPQD